MLILCFSFPTVVSDQTSMFVSSIVGVCTCAGEFQPESAGCYCQQLLQQGCVCVCFMTSFLGVSSLCLCVFKDGKPFVFDGSDRGSPAQSESSSIFLSFSNFRNVEKAF